MKLLKLLPTLALAMGVSVAFAGSPKGEANTSATTSKTQAKSEVKAKAETTYWVVSQDGDNYMLSTNPADEGNCDGGNLPCKITSSNASLTSITQDDIDNHVDDIEVKETRQSF